MGDNLQILDEVVAEGYVQHDPLAGEGREGLRQFFQRLVPLPDWLDSRGTVVVNLIAEGEFIVRQEMTQDCSSTSSACETGCSEALGRLPSRPWTERIPDLVASGLYADDIASSRLIMAGHEVWIIREMFNDPTRDSSCL